MQELHHTFTDGLTLKGHKEVLWGTTSTNVTTTNTTHTSTTSTSATTMSTTATRR